MTKKQAINIFWFRRDLRLYDNKGLYHALKENKNVIQLFIFDTDITDSLPENDARVEFIYESIQQMQNALLQRHRNMVVYKGKPLEIFQKLTKDYQIKSVYCNKDHEPYGIERDEKISKFLQSKNIEFYSYLDHLLFDKDDVLKNDGTPYHVFSPYGRKCREVLTEDHLKYYPSEDHLTNFDKIENVKFPDIKDLGFKPSGVEFPEKENKASIIQTYDKTRDYPAQKGTTRLGIHLRFGTVSLRQLAKKALEDNDTYFNELLWREFYAMILWHYPKVVNTSFKPQYDNIEWQNDKEQFEKWKNGKTGYPMVDAGMRELAQTGYMHNRVRMITASFLTKHLLIDWRWGEAWFAEKLLDFELSSNNGGWQWSAGSGCDAAPYFRIFNPAEQQKKFDSKSEYIKKWVPEADSDKYPQPIVEHKFARQRCLNTFKKALNNYK
ncbi:MAG: deoxyribodipyrimidine photo-lyase [Bacteroidetes bacterium]|nr:MAG: deoxyribodipyrimidine photo-lyase [Bacteroidota bacterium]